ncbi:MAG TPA: response regulator [bacterium]|nr:response regulator [bacterium]HPN32341.1 response regulator [bacterium]
MKKVLIVDDAMVMRMMLRDILEKNGFEVVGEAKDGLEGEKLYLELKPDVVTMDISMPQCDGIQAVKLIKKNDPGAKIIMISALGQKEQVLEAIKSGAKDFIVKPFDETNVLNTIKRITQ